MLSRLGDDHSQDPMVEGSACLVEVKTSRQGEGPTKGSDCTFADPDFSSGCGGSDSGIFVGFRDSGGFCALLLFTLVGYLFDGHALPTGFFGRVLFERGFASSANDERSTFVTVFDVHLALFISGDFNLYAVFGLRFADVRSVDLALTGIAEVRRLKAQEGVVIEDVPEAVVAGYREEGRKECHLCIFARSCRRFCGFARVSLMEWDWGPLGSFYT